jgi:hypothetical protein
MGIDAVICTARFDETVEQLFKKLSIKSIKQNKRRQILNMERKTNGKKKSTEVQKKQNTEDTEKVELRNITKTA